MQMDKEFTSSLKSVETENRLDLYFYRPIAFRIARVLKNTFVTPNMVTVLSIFVGAGTGFMFYFDNLILNLFGIFLLVTANILDCVDGQLARLTGIKSKIGRILDGIAGDIWFFMIYICLASRLTHEFGTAWFFIPATLSGLSHLLQANITDYYKTLHLFIESKEKGSEFQNKEQIEAQRQKMTGFRKVFFSMYVIYTGVQEKMTPVLQELLVRFKTEYGDEIPQPIRLKFRRESCRIMKQCIDFMTFNGRTVVLFLVILSGYVWIYFIYEIIFLNFILFLSIKMHEKLCNKLYNEISGI
jgi:phosphatidylglycerophosphate synthase